MSGLTGMINERRTTLYLRFFSFLGLSAILAVPLIGKALSAPKPLKYIDAKIESKIIASARLADLRVPPVSPLVWCYKEEPAFAYVRGRAVVIVTFGGSLQEIINTDRELSGSSLECSDDGAVVTVFSRDTAELFIKVKSQVGHYKTSLSSPRGSLKMGHILSPGGAVIAVPFDLTFVSGDDVLSAMRVLKVEGDHFGWRNDELLYIDRPTSTVRSYDSNADKTSIVGNIADWHPSHDYEVHNIVACHRASLASINWRFTNAGAAETEFASKVISMSAPLVEVATESGKLSDEFWSVSANGRPNSMCIISRFAMVGGLEVTKYELLFYDGLVKYALPRGVGFDYDVAIAPRDCLVLGRKYFFGKGEVLNSETLVVALRITRSGRCGA